MAAMAVARPAYAQFGYQELHSFEYGVENPERGVVDGGDGYLYGTKSSGGHKESGVVFRIEKATKTLAILYTFDYQQPLNGYTPYSGLTDGGDGFLYGSTYQGGVYGRGTIFKLEKSTGTLTTIHSLNDTAPFKEGANPFRTLTLAADGYFYGTTTSGGTYGNGTVFRISPTTEAWTTLYAFNGPSGGPYNTQQDDGPVDGGDGFIYGTTQYGGAASFGAVYKIDQATGAFTTLYNFTSQTNPLGVEDGGNGYLYGTTQIGGTSGLGTLYKLSKSTGAFTLLHSFTGGIGYYPLSALTSGSDGYLYGTTQYGGSLGGGTIFKVNTTTDVVAVVHSFQSTTEGQQSRRLTVSGNNLYGAAEYGGASQRGTVYGVEKTTGATTVYASFGREPRGVVKELVDAGNGYLYGVTETGGVGYGVLFKVSKASGSRTAVHEFNTLGGVGTFGYYPTTLIRGEDGYLYGETSYGGQIGYGTLFRVAIANDALSVLRPYALSEGYYRVNSRLSLGGGFLYGTSFYGGTIGYGALYQVNKVTGATTILYNFSSFNYASDIVDGANGYLYGTTQGGGQNGCGALYKLNASNPGAVTVLHSFSCSGVEAYYPMSLMDGGDGFIYVTAVYGGSGGRGAVFKLEKSTDTFSTFYSFLNNPSQGQYPYGRLLLGRDGHLYGTTQSGGAYGYGTAYVLDRTTGAFGLYHSFSRSAGEGVYPLAGLSQGVSPDDTIYGVTQQGGSLGGGAIFAFDTGMLGQAITVTNTPPASSVYLSSFFVSATGGGSGNPVVITASGACSGSGSNNATISMQSGTGVCTVAFNQPGGPNYNPAPTVVSTTNAVKRGASLSAPNPSYTYDGTPKALTGVTTSPANLVVDITYNNATYVSTSAPPTNVGSYTATLTINDLNYQGTFFRTLTINKATGSVSLSNLNQTYTGSPLTPTATTTPAGLAVTWNQTPTNVGSYSVTATINDTNYQGSAVGTLVIAKATATVTLSNLVQTYNGSQRPVTVATSPTGLSVSTIYTGVGGTSYGPSGAAPTNAGSYTATATVNSSNYQGSATDTLVVAKAPATLTLSNLSQTYSGGSRVVPVTSSPSSLSGITVTYDASTTPPINAGSYAVVASLTNTNYSAPNASGTLVVIKANATITLSNLTQTYTGSALSPTATTSPFGLGISWTNAPQTGAGSYAVTATITDANYQGTANGTFLIQKATASVILGNLTQPYTGSALSPTATTTPPGLGITWTNAPQTAAGSYGVTATVNDSNYQGSVNGTFVIQKAMASVGLSNLTQTYTGSALTPTATTTPPGLGITWTNAPQTAAGSYSVTATINDSNYQGTANGTFLIEKATASVVLSNLTQTYTGSALSPTATTTPPGLGISWTNAPQTAAGSYGVTATISDANYQGTANGTFLIEKATANVVLSNLTQPYTGSALSPTATTTPPGLAISVTNAPQTAPGSYGVTATVSDSNYQGTANGTFLIEKATASVVLSNLTQTYTGSALSPTATTTPPGLAITWTNAPQTAAGSYSVTATINDANYQGTTNGTFLIEKATASVVLSNLTQTYTGSALSPTATTTPPGLGISWTNAPQTAAGSYGVTATISDANYQGTANGTFLIEKATANVVLSNLTQPYTGGALSPAATTTPAGLGVTLTNAPQTAPGSYGITATINDPNYQGTANGTFLIAKATATIVLSNLTQTYTGSTLSPTATTTPSGLGITWTNAPQTNAGSYAITATVNDANYQGTANATFLIQKATASVVLSNLAQTYTGSPLTPTVSTTPPGLAIAWTNAPQTAAGSYQVAATVNDLNYQGTASGTFTVAHTWSNVLQPIDLDNSSIFKLGSTVPVKFQLTGGSAPVTNLAAQIFVAKLSNNVVGDELEAVSTSAADVGNTFRYSDGQYIFNLSTKSLSQGTWQIRIDLKDGVTHSVLISIKK